MNLKKGDLLIADPSILNDDSFNRTIILLIEHNLKSTVGFIVNRPLDFHMKDVFPEIDCNLTLYEGGPVAIDSLFYLHKVPNLIPNSSKISKNIYYGGNFEVVKNLLLTKQINAKEIRFFLGYTGWDKNQLENEIESKSWFVTENNFNNLFATEDSLLWKNKILEKGGEYKIWSNAPKDVDWN
jgi:putative transcriptional regulator